MSCLEVRALLPLRPLEALEENEESLVEQHLESCSTCRAEAKAHDGALDELAVALRGPEHEPRAGLAAALWEKVEEAIDKPAAEPAPAPAGPELSISLACSYCHDGLVRSQVCYCASCLAPHHEECFRAHGRCSAIGCEETLTVRPTGLTPLVVLEGKRPPARRRVGRMIASGLASALVAGGLAALVERGTRSPDRPRRSGTLVSVPPESSPPSGPALRPAIPEVTFDVDARNLGIREVVAMISSASGQDVLVSPDVQMRATLRLRGVNVREALDELARSCGLDVEPLGQSLFVLTRPKLVTYHCQEADVVAALREVARQGGRNVLVSPLCRGGPVTVELNAEKSLAALVAIVRAAGLELARAGEILVVLPARDPEATARSTNEAARLDAEARRFAGGHESDLGHDPARVFDFDFESEDLHDACDRIARSAGVNVIVGAGLAANVRLALHKVSWEDALVAVAWSTGTRIGKRGQIVVLEAAPTARLTAARAPASEWFRLLAAGSTDNFVVAPDVTDEITGELEGVSSHDALEATALAYGYKKVQEKDGLWRVSVDPTARNRPGVGELPAAKDKKGEADLLAVPTPLDGATLCEQDGKIRVLEVAAGSPAAALGLAPHDAILALDDVPVRLSSDLLERAAGLAPEAALLLRIERDGQELVLGHAAREGKTPPTRALQKGYLGVLLGANLTVEGVAEGSPAEKEGIRKGDVLVALDGKKLASFDDFAVRVWQPGDKVVLTLGREGWETNRTLIAAVRPEKK